MPQHVLYCQGKLGDNIKIYCLPVIDKPYEKNTIKETHGHSSLQKSDIQVQYKTGNTE